MADFTEAIRLEPDDAEHYRMRADCWFAMKQFDKAIAEAEEALRLSPKLHSAADVRRQSLEAKQQPVKANDRYSEASPYGAERSSDARFEGAYWLELRGPKGVAFTKILSASTA